MKTIVALFPTLALAAGMALAQAPAAPAPGAAEAPKAARENGLYVTLQIAQGATPMGPIVLKLYETESPVTVKNFVDLALGRKAWKDPKTGATVRRPLYNGLTFHRVIPGFMVQGGDPTGTGMGGTDVIKDEFHPTLKFDQPGRLAMANAGPGTGSCQFFITEVPTPHLNGAHTIFGQVVEGQPFVKVITGVAKNGAGKPNVPVVIQKVTFERVGPMPAGGVSLGAAPAPAAAKPAAAKAPAAAPAAGKAPTSGNAPAAKAPAATPKK